MSKGQRLTSSISSKGQVTIPLEIRLRLGLKPGDQVEFVTQGKETVIRPARSGDNPFRKYVGIAGDFPGGVGEINAWVRGMRDTDDDSEND
jgi:AbrB family looped-hinge helix DNA binding protein